MSPSGTIGSQQSQDDADTRPSQTQNEEEPTAALDLITDRGSGETSTSTIVTKPDFDTKSDRGAEDDGDSSH